MQEAVARLRPKVRVGEPLEHEAWYGSSSSSAGKRRKKKKRRRKRKTPNTSSSRAARTRKSGHSSASSSVLAVWNDHPGGVMSTAQRQFCIGLCLQLVLWVTVASFIRTWRRTRAVLPSMLAGFAGYDAPRVPFAWR